MVRPERRLEFVTNRSSAGNVSDLSRRGDAAGYKYAVGAADARPHTDTHSHAHSLTDRSNLGEGRVAIEYYC
jgi:hypothetical protein